MPAKRKFNKGDKVRFTNLAPKYILAEVPRRRTRTIKTVGYDPVAQHCLYEIGDRGNQSFSYYFRAEQLYLANGKTHIIGRPRQKNSELQNRINRKTAAMLKEGVTNAYD